MRGISFVVAAVIAAKVSAEDTNAAKDNAYMLAAPPRYSRFMDPAVYAEPRYMVVEEPRYMPGEPRYIGEPRFIEQPHYMPQPFYDEPRARYIEMPQYGSHY